MRGHVRSGLHTTSPFSPAHPSPGNAFKFSPAGSVSIAIGCDKVNAASQAAARALLQPQPFETAEDDAPSNSPQWTFSTAEVSEMEICAPQTTLSLPDAGDGATWDHVPVLGRLHRHLQREPLDGDSSASATHATPSPSSSSERSACVGVHGGVYDEALICAQPNLFH